MSVVGLQVPIGQNVVVGRLDRAGRHLARQSRPVLDDQGVGADVIGSRGDRGVQGRLPVRVRFAGCAIDQVQVDVLETDRSCLCDRCHRTLRSMLPVKDGEHVR